MRRWILLGAALASPALGQTPPGASTPTSSTAASPAAGATPAVALPAPIAADDPLAPLPPLPANDPLLVTPLPPLASFDATPPASVAIGASSAEATARYAVRIDGFDAVDLLDPFRTVSELWRGRGKPATAGQLAARLRGDIGTAKTLLESEGYYAGSADGAIAASADGRSEVTLTADPGTRYTWAKVNLDVIPDGREDLRAIFKLQPGNPIRAAEVEAAESEYTLRLANIGFPFAELGARDVELDDATRTGDYLLTGSVGPVARIDSIELSGYQPFDVRHARLIARFRPGDRYSALLVEDFRRALVATQLFAGVTVRPVDIGRRNADGSAVTTIQVTGNRGPLKLLAGQIGYATTEGARAEVQWRHRNLFPAEGALTVRGVVGSREQLIGAEVRKANFGQRDRTLLAIAEVANENRPAYQARTLTLSGRLSRDSTPIWQKRWTYSVGAELLGIDTRDRAVATGVVTDRRQFLVAALPLQLGYDRTEDLLNPTSGFRALARVSPEASLQGGQFRGYARLLAEVSAYKGFGADDKYVLAGRLRLGSIPGIARVDLAPNRRYYAGGGGSVRGYDYQGVGPRDPNNLPLGGRSLNEGSVELRYRFGDFGVVGFLDAGQVYEGVTPRFTGLRYGAGVGGRYYTSFGPFRIDLARGLNRQRGDPKFALYISIGQAF